MFTKMRFVVYGRNGRGSHFNDPLVPTLWGTMYSAFIITRKRR